MWKKVAFALTLKGGHLAAGPVSLALPDGPLRATLTVDASSDVVPVALSLHAPGIPLSLLACVQREQAASFRELAAIDYNIEEKPPTDPDAPAPPVPRGNS